MSFQQKLEFETSSKLAMCIESQFKSGMTQNWSKKEQKKEQKMMDLVNGFIADMKAGPTWVYIWILFMGFMFMLSVPFSFKNKHARLILLATLILAPIIMMGLYAKFGYQRILGLGHILAWTPILYLLLRDRKNWQIGDSWVGKWLVLTIIVMLISLVFDTSDVVRYALGERG